MELPFNAGLIGFYKKRYISVKAG